MPNITLALPEEIFTLMKKYSEIRWSEVARQAIERYAKKLALMEKLEYEAKMKQFNELLKESTLTEEDVMALDEKVKESLFKKIAETLR
jgi:hypothetical protein